MSVKVILATVQLGFEQTFDQERQEYLLNLLSDTEKVAWLKEHNAIIQHGRKDVRSGPDRYEYIYFEDYIYTMLDEELATEYYLRF